MDGARRAELTCVANLTKNLLTQEGFSGQMISLEEPRMDRKLAQLLTKDNSKEQGGQLQRSGQL